MEDQRRANRETKNEYAFGTQKEFFLRRKNRRRPKQNKSANNH